MLRKLDPHLQDAKKRLPHLARVLNLIWRATSFGMVAWLALLILSGLLPTLTVNLTRSFVDGLAGLIQSGSMNAGNWEKIIPTALLAVGLGLLMLFGQVTQSLSSWLNLGMSERVGVYISDIIHEKSSQIDFSFFDKPANYDRLRRAQAEATYRPMAVLGNIGTLLQSGITLIGLAAILLPYGLWLPLVLLVSSIPALWIIVYYQLVEHSWQKKVTPLERQYWYYEFLLVTRISAAEIRLFGLGEHYRKLYRTIRQQLTAERLHIHRSRLLFQLAAGLLGLLVVAGCLGWMGWRVLIGQATLGDLALFYQSFNLGQSLVRGVMQNAGELYGSLIFLENLFEFLDLESSQVVSPIATDTPRPGEPVTIKFENVTFAYPGSEQPLFTDFDLQIPSGKITAIVGDNGAGKSTLIKLLCRLYDPQTGKIMWNGVNLRDFNLEDLRSQITVLFQEPVQYQATVSDNIHFSRLNQATESEIITAANLAGADDFIKNLPHGYQNMLGKMFDGGTDLSTGQWQRIALARAFLRQAPLMLLDEPTSAMDAWAETDWLQRLRQLSIGRTTVIITHRLTTAMQADLIYVMVGGKMIESGTHSELLARNGRYAMAWKAQMNVPA
jgi:ATP-binding cassette subfamily B protein